MKPELKRRYDRLIFELYGDVPYGYDPIDLLSAINDLPERCFRRSRVNANAKVANRLPIIIIKRFGLENNTIMSLSEVGDYFGVTRERIRQQEHTALRMLRHQSIQPKIFGATLKELKRTELKRLNKPCPKV